MDEQLRKRFEEHRFVGKLRKLVLESQQRTEGLGHAFHSHGSSVNSTCSITSSLSGHEIFKIDEFRYHLGTVALGSLVTSLLGIFDGVLQFFNQYATKIGNKASTIEYIACCCLSLVNAVIYLSSNAYVMCALHGKYGLLHVRKECFQLDYEEHNESSGQHTGEDQSKYFEMFFNQRH